MIQCSHRNHVEESSAKNQVSLLVSEQKGEGANAGVLILAPHVTFCPRAWVWHRLQKLLSPGYGSELFQSPLSLQAAEQGSCGAVLASWG